MQLLPVTRGLILPHAPVLLSEVANEQAAEGERVRQAIARLHLSDVDLIVLLSPHGDSSGVYGSHSGTLDGFGVAGISARLKEAPGPAEKLAAAWGKPLLPGSLDHGVTVPLLLKGFDARPTVAAALVEATGPGAAGMAEALDDARVFAGAVATLEEDVAFIASAHGSAALTPGAPLTERPGARALDEDILAALQSDCGELCSIPAAAWVQGGACGAGPLTVFGMLLAGKAADTVTYDAPFGVGYLVATAGGAAAGAEP